MAKKTDRVGSLQREVDLLTVKLAATIKELEALQRRTMALELDRPGPRIPRAGSAYEPRRFPEQGTAMRGVPWLAR